MQDFESSQRLWQDQINNEVAFWRVFCETRGREWPDDFKTRIDATQELQPYLQEMLDPSRPPEVISILDVGAGPMTYLGKCWRGTRLNIVAVDPLADQYPQILTAAGISVPIPTIAGQAEELSAQFRPGQFDLVYARNCIDHSVDPVRAIGEMLTVARAGGYLYLEHKVREGQIEGYEGLHQWDFYVEGGQFHIASPRYAPVNVSVIFEKTAQTRTVDHQNGWMTVILRKV